MPNDPCLMAEGVVKSETVIESLGWNGYVNDRYRVIEGLWSGQAE